jgi:hypothetical protein
MIGSYSADMNTLGTRRTALRGGAIALTALSTLLSVPAVAAPKPVKAEVKISCDPGTWRVEYTASGNGHAAGSTPLTRIDIGVIDQYGPDQSMPAGSPQAGPYGLGSTATTGDVARTADTDGAWSTHGVVTEGGHPNGYPRTHTRTTTVTLHVKDGNQQATAEDTCTLTAA